MHRSAKLTKKNSLKKITKKSDSRNAVHSKWRIAPTHTPKIKITLNLRKDGDDDRIVGGGLIIIIGPSPGHRLRHGQRQWHYERDMSGRLRPAFHRFPVRVHHEWDHVERGGPLRHFRQRHLDDYPLQASDEKQHQLPADRIGSMRYCAYNHVVVALRSARDISLYGMFI